MIHGKHMTVSSLKCYAKHSPMIKVTSISMKSIYAAELRMFNVHVWISADIESPWKPEIFSQIVTAFFWKSFLKIQFYDL